MNLATCLHEYKNFYINFPYNIMKGIILAGGNGTRLQPVTKYLNKHLFPIYNKPMILFPLETLKSVGIKDIIVIVDRYRADKIIEFLGSGKDYDVSITYKVQEQPAGIANAISLCETITNNEKVFVVLGDNIVFDNLKNDADNFKNGCKIFLKRVNDPDRFGVPIFTSEQKIKNIVEKPKDPPNKFAVTGVYIFDNTVYKKIKICKPSQRGELEITDVLNQYAKEQKIEYRELKNSWIDAGTFSSLYEASEFVREINLKNKKL